MKRLLIGATLILALAAPAHAGPQDLANDISNQVMSPFCPGVTLHDCPSKAALDLREKIGEWAEQGWTREQIVSELEAQYGTSIRGAPPARGSGILAWALPILALVAGLGVAVMLARRWTRPPSHDAVDTVSPDDRRRLEMELDAFRSEA